MNKFNINLLLQALISVSVISANSYALAGQYDNLVLDEVSAKEFIMLLDQPVPKLFKRTQLPNAQNNLCTVKNGQASSLAIASKLRVVGGSGAVTTLQAATGSNSTGNTTANTTAQNNTTAQASNNKPNANTSTSTSTSTSTNNRANSGEVLNTQNSGNQTSSANNSTYVPSLPTPRTNSANASTTNTNTNNNSSAVVSNNSTGNTSNTANTSTARANNNTTANTNTNTNASSVRVNNQANGVQTAQNTTTRQASASSVSQNNANANANVPYVGNAIATVNLAINFGNDSDKLSVKDKTLLKELAQALNSTELRQSEFAIVGHTSSTGPYLRNLELSCARAIAVRNHLVNLGVKGTRLTPYGFGPDKPLANVAAKEVANRRVEISRAK